MPKVVFSKPFYDGTQRYREGEVYEFESLDGLPKLGIKEVDGKPYKVDSSIKQEPKQEAPEEPVSGDTDAKVIEAIGQLTPGEEDHWTTDGRPEVKAINSLLDGVKITAADRDRIWAEMNK